MKYLVSLTAILLMVSGVYAQQGKVQLLPPQTFVTMRDSTTSIDVVFTQGKGGSLSLEGRNATLFNSFFEYIGAQKSNTPQAGSIMWQINGREFLSGSFYIGDSTGYLVVKRDNREYVSKINAQGNTFLKSQIKK